MITGELDTALYNCWEIYCIVSQVHVVDYKNYEFIKKYVIFISSENP
jgi:hypothetical protein